MRVLVWVLVWMLLLAGSAWYLWQRLRRVGRAAGRLGGQLSEAERMLTRIQRQAAAAGEGQADRHTMTNQASRADATELAVFTGTRQAVTERRAVRRALTEAKRARRAAKLPGWARRVDSDPT